MKEKIIEILEMYRYSTTEGEYPKLTDEACNNLATEIDTLYKADLDKRVAFEVACNPDLLEAQTNYKLYESEINQLKEIINILSDFAQYGPFAFSEEEIMMRLEKVEQLKKGAGL